MNFKKTKVAVASGLMAASMVLAPLAAYASVAQDKIIGENDLKVKKTVLYPEKGVTLQMPEGVDSFGFTASFQTSSLVDGAQGSAPSSFTGTLTPDFANASGGTWTNENVTISAKKTDGSAFEWTGVTPGCYEYDLTEDKMGSGVDETYTALDSYGFGWTFNSANTTYRLRVYVSAKNTGTEADPVYSETERTVKYTLIDTSKADGEEVGSNDYDALKVASADFKNIYTARGGSKTGGDEEDPALTVSKTANGEYDDQTKAFDFYISFTYPMVDGTQLLPLTGNNETMGTILTTGSSEGVALTATSGDEMNIGQYRFSLKNGEQIVFVNLPAGTTYTITEAADAQYKVSGLEVKEDGNDVSLSATTGTKATAFTVAKADGTDLVVGDHHNEVKFTNTRADSITVTGVVTHSAPFVIMVGALFVAVGGYVVLKKRIEE